jgi:hypothetical protein
MECEVFVDGVWVATIPGDVGLALEMGDEIEVESKVDMMPNGEPGVLRLKVYGRKVNLGAKRPRIELGCACDDEWRKPEPALSDSTPRFRFVEHVTNEVIEVPISQVHIRPDGRVSKRTPNDGGCTSSCCPSCTGNADAWRKKEPEPVLSKKQNADFERMVDRVSRPRFVDHHGREVCGNDDNGIILCSRVKDHTGNHAIMKTANDMGSVSCDKTRDGSRCVLLPNHNGSCVFEARAVELEQMAIDTAEQAERCNKLVRTPLPCGERVEWHQCQGYLGYPDGCQ